jgi:hypothetical protein
MSPSVLNFFSSRFEMEESVQSRFLAAALSFRDAEGILDPTALAVAPELAVLFFPMAASELLGKGAMARTKARRKMSSAAGVKD